MTPEQIVLRPIALTEKATALTRHGQVTFEVARAANKVEIRSAVEALFRVRVVAVRTMVVRGKERRMGRGHARLKNWKKAVVTLGGGSSIDFFADRVG